MSKEKDWLEGVIKEQKEKNFSIMAKRILPEKEQIKNIAHSIRQELIKRLEGKRKKVGVDWKIGTQISYAHEIHNVVIDEIIKEI